MRIDREKMDTKVRIEKKDPIKVWFHLWPLCSRTKEKCDQY